MKTRFTPALALLGALLTMAAGRSAADPMRPLLAPASSASASAASSATPTNSPHSAAAQPILQADRLVAIRRDADGRFQALIGDRWVGIGEPVGGRAGAAVVRALDGHSVTLALGRQRLVLHVLPPLLASRDDSAASPTPVADTPPRTAALNPAAARTPQRTTP